MTHRQRFLNVFQQEPIDRLPLYYFGSWPETKQRWHEEGLAGPVAHTDCGPQLPGMDPDWEDGLWGAHGTVYLGAFGDVEPAVLERREGIEVRRNAIGKVEEVRTDGSSISHTLSYPLEPTRASWQAFKRYLDPNLPGRYPADSTAIAKARNEKDIVTGFMGGSLYAWLRDFMGVEQLSYLMYDDPVLMEEMVDTLTDHFMTLLGPVLDTLKCEFVYFFEDCCGAFGPLFSPAIYREVFDKYYRRLISFYKDKGVPLALIDSDGMVEPLVPCWLGSGFDIIFPLEVGKWQANPGAMREKFGKDLRMLGGVDKGLIYGPEGELVAHLEGLRPAVEAGGFLPIPDHRIPPQVSYDQMLRYIELFQQVFWR